jgi:hypothetical protein
MQRLDGRLVLSATDLSSFLACRHRTGLDMAVADRRLERPVRDDALVAALRLKGHEHEQRYVQWLVGQGLRSSTSERVPDATTARWPHSTPVQT